MTMSQTYFEYPFIPRIDSKDVSSYFQRASPLGVERVTEVATPYGKMTNVLQENAQSAFIPGLSCKCGSLTVDNVCIRPGVAEVSPFVPLTKDQKDYFTELWQTTSAPQQPAARAMEYRAAPRN